jgi:hypothetical protein
MVSFAAMPSSGTTDSSLGSQGDSSFFENEADANAIEKIAVQRMPPVPGTAGWSLVTSPNRSAAPGSNDLPGVTCVSASDCWAVGTSFGGVVQTIIEHWDGTSWSTVSSPNASDAPGNYLLGVTCVSASDCWAVGSYFNLNAPGSSFLTLTEHWNGTSWSIVSSPSIYAADYNVLNSVTCASASDCWAVGYNDDGTLIERWDGTSWSIVPSPNVTQYNALRGVTCASASECWAVGFYDYYENGVGFISQTLIEHWDGTSWSIIASPNTSATQDNVLYGVTCTSASDCWAVGRGRYELQTLIEHWDGASWSIVTSPNPNPNYFNVLYGVTCASASECWAIGYYDNNNYRSQTLIEHWDGTSWSIVTSPNTSSTQDNILYGVTCASASECWAVGDYFDYTNTNAVGPTLIEHWDGASWSIVTSPNVPETPQHNQLYGVTCSSASECWAVGSTQNNYQTLIERWDGASWSIVASPNTTRPNSLSAVTCASASDCWAVGNYFSYGGDDIFVYQTLIEHWDGTTWSIVISPNASATEDSHLTGVTCASATQCWAIGYSDTGYIGSVKKTLIERWDGASWSIVTSPNTSSTQDNVLSGVTCVTPRQCWAVGYSGVQTLIERWDGTAWSIVTSPNTGSMQDNVLTGVTCATPRQCWAVGYYYTGTVYQTLIEQWDGTSWAIVASPNSSATQNNVLGSATCASPSNCWAVGTSNDSNSSVARTLIEHWNGISWLIVSSPNTSSMQDNVLTGVTCATPRQCWAVGTYYAYRNFLAQTLIEGFSPQSRR